MIKMTGAYTPKKTAQSIGIEIGLECVKILTMGMGKREKRDL